MGEDSRDFSRILEVLKENPRGMSVKQISEAIGVNRISVGHYLEIMLLLGQVDMESYGQAKVFYESKRVPMFAMMDFTSDYVLFVTENCHIIRANKKFAELVDLNSTDIEGLECSEVFKKLDINIKDHFDKASVTEEVSGEIAVCKNGKKLFFKIKILPTVYTEGSPGYTIIMEDITDIKVSMEALKAGEARLKELVQSIGKFLGDIEQLEKLNADIRNPLQTIVGITDLEGGKTAGIVYNQAVQIDNKLKEIDIGWREAENIREFIKKYIPAGESR